ncbi:Uncharacterised protein [Candidatus Venteria ishoeyi]|uniref:Uncharacterized protein n=1 Tax=Candidatus Venteria ishoeyi TaxID=1899563 RepID=A0A1H6F8M3_9GAMM|nr:Uncharacterised protein [Candidatus Venteria ishoeyi]
MPGIRKIRISKLILSVRKKPMPGVCMICTAIPGSGCRIGLENTQQKSRKTLGIRIQAPTGLSAVVVGATLHAAVVQLFATGTTRPTATATSAFAWQGLALGPLTLTRIGINPLRRKCHRNMSAAVVTVCKMVAKGHKWCICPAELL